MGSTRWGLEINVSVDARDGRRCSHSETAQVAAELPEFDHAPMLDGFLAPFSGPKTFSGPTLTELHLPSNAHSIASRVPLDSRRCSAIGATHVAALLPGCDDARVLDGCLLPCSGPRTSEITDPASSENEHAIADEGRREAPIGLQLFNAVHTIREMQGCLEEQLLRRHNEILSLIQDVRTRSVCMPSLVMDDTGKPSGRSSMGPSGHVEVESEDFDEQPEMMSSSAIEGDESLFDARVVDRDAARSRPPAFSSTLTAASAPKQMQRQNTDEYTKLALKRANLTVISEPKLSLLTASAQLVQKRLRGNAAARLLRWNGFDVCIGWVILLNSISIGWEINMSAQGNVSTRTQTALKVFEYAFLVIYTGELVLRFYVDGLSALKNRWVVFDCALVASGLCAAIIRNLLQAAADPALREAMEQVMLLRIIRLLRLVRALRLVHRFKTLWRLVNGLLTSLDTILSTMALLALVLYVASCIGVELIAGNESLYTKPDVAALIRSEYSSVPSTMLSLMQFVTMDDLSELYKPIIKEQPFMSIYFIIILMIIPIALLNLVTAVLVEGALEKSRKDNEMEAITLRRQVKNFLPLAREFFKRIDEDNCGAITLRQIQHKLEDERGCEELRQRLKQMIPFESVEELFESLDVDGNGELVEQEFVDGVLKSALAGHDNMEIAQVMRLLRVHGRKMEKVEARLARVLSTGTLDFAST